MKNILWVSGITADYRIKFFDSVRTELRFHGFDLIVVAGKGEIHGRSSDNQVPGVTYLPLTKVRRFGKEFVTLDGLSKTISEHLPVAVVVGAHLNDRTAIDIRGSGYRGKLIGLVCGYEPSGIVMSNVKAAAWRTFRRRLFDQFLAYGFFSRAWLKRNGVSEDLVTYFKNSTISAEDLEHSGAAVPSNPNRKSLHVVYAGTMTKDKKCEEILRAAMTLPEHRFYLYGGGPELDRLMAIRDGEQITNVSFHDRLGRHELLSKLREFDVAVMPGTGGLFALDALASGLPIVASHGDGSVADMVINGYNGFVRNSVDAEFIADRLSALGSNRALLHWMKENTQESVQSYTTENAARRVVGAVIDAQPIE